MHESATYNKLPSVLAKSLIASFLLLWASGLSYANDMSPYLLLSAEELESQNPTNNSVKLALIRKYGQTNQQLAIELLNSISEGSMTASESLVSQAYYCEINIRQGMMDIASPYCDEVKSRLTMERTDGLSRAIAFNSIGYLYLRAGQSDLALEQYESALQQPGFDDAVIRLHLMHNRGVALNLSGLTEMAIEAFESANEDIGVLAGDESLSIILNYNLGYVQAQAGKHEEALKSYATTLPWLQETGQLTRAYISHTQVALSLSGLGRHQEALDELLPWMERTDFSVTADSSAQAYLALAQAYLGLGDANSAEKYLLLGIDVANENSNPSRLRELSLVYSEMLLERDQPREAAEYLNAMFEIFQQHELRVDLGPAHNLLAEAYAAMGNFEAALGHSQDAIDSYQETQSSDFARRLASLRVSNELNLRNQQLATAIESERAAVASRQLEFAFQIATVVALIVILVLLHLNLSRRANRKEALSHMEAATKLKGEVEARTKEVEEVLEEKYASEQRKAELEVRVAKDDKLRVIGQLTGGVAHDFNNIMTVVQLSSELLLSKIDKSQQKLAQDILTAVNSGKAITRGLLAYARQQVLQPTIIELNEYFATNTDIFMRSIDESVHFGIELNQDGGALVIKADTGQLTSSILNLILNAKEAIDEGGTILVIAQRRGDKVSVEVRDDGRGMSEQELKAATEPFYTTKAMAEGSGLGLSMVEGFMKQSGGEILIESTLGSGTTVILEFDAQNLAEKETDTKLEALPIDSDYCILLVEDEDQIRDVASQVLEGAGYKVVTASSGEEALELFESIENLSLVITDMVMPGEVSGEKLIQEVLLKQADLPVLLTSGYSSNTSTGHPFLAKPFSTESLLSMVTTLTKNQ